MKTYTIENKPSDMVTMRKTATIEIARIDEPFEVETGEGKLLIDPDTCEDWDEGYFVAYPADGTKPYPISPSFISENYVPVVIEVTP